MSTRSERAPAPSGGGLSVTTLAIASVSSVAAAIFIHKFWTGGAILGAGITPIIVAVVSEALKRPTAAITQVRASRTSREYEGDATAHVAPDPGAPAPREDRFGIWEDEGRKGGGLRWHRLRGKPLKLALATGALAFVIGAFALTGADLVFGGPGGGGDRFTVIPGKQQKSDDDDKTKTTTTQTTETVTQTQTVPAEPDEAPTETTPQQVPTTPQTVPTTPTVPPTATTPPAQTVPPPTPAPAPTP